jgi:hypothetical protein
MFFQNWFTGFGPEKFEPRMTRMGTDNEEARGYAWASQAGSSEPDSMASKLADAPVSESLTRFASGPAFSRFAQDAWNMGNENTGMLLACQAGRCFGKASESSLASDFSKQLQHSRSESTLGFLGKNWFGHIRVNP